MTSSKEAPPSGTRRNLLLRSGSAALALGATAAHAAKTGAGTPRPTTPTWKITRSRYSIAADTYLTAVGEAFVVPLATVVFTDGNTDSTLNANNTITINTAGNYRILLATDWNSGKGHDAGLRTAGVRYRPVGSPAIVPPGDGSLIPIASDTDVHFCTYDDPGSATPITVRMPAPPDGSVAHGNGHYTPIPWTPGTLAPGASATLDLTMPVTGIVAPGDSALAALDSINDAAIGKTAVATLMLSAKVIAADTVRVVLFNPPYAPAVTVPQGNLQVLGMSGTNIAGGSSEARTVISSVTMPLAVGDVVYALFSSLTPGDVLQASAEMYVEVEHFIQTS